MIIATTIAQLFMCTIDAHPNRRRRTKIKRGAGDGGQCARWNQIGVDRGIAVGVDHHYMIEYGTAAG